ncbi:HAMP domain protein [Chlamydia ibidis]|uniref:HAMP domain protein n=1 Tax=Chlamydia ibidis TaxID=1405396 RepID=S7J436_9CHLA|nr:HAMP domain protein [Chlamydia ibidis]
MACVVAIILPLGLNIVLLGMKQYRHTLAFASLAFQENAGSKANTLSQIAPLNADILSLFTDVLDLDESMIHSPNLKLSQDMEKIFRSTYEEISLINFSPNGDKIVVASSVPDKLGKNYNHIINITDEKTFLATLKQSRDNHQIYSVMQANIFDSDTHQILGMLYTTYNIENFLKDLLINTQSYLTIKTAIVSPNGVILKAADPELYLHSIYPNTKQGSVCDIFLNEKPCSGFGLIKFLKLSPIHLGKGFYSFKINNKEVWGYLTRVPTMDFSVLSYSEKDAIFAPLWKRSLLYSAYFLCIAIGSSLAYYVAKRISQPIRKLATVMIQTSQDHPQIYVDDSLGFEVNRLGQIFNAMVRNLNQQQILAQKNYEIKETAQNALLLGEQAQQRLLPNTLPFYPYVELAKAYIPAITVGGDFFDIFVVGDNDNAKLFLVVADASGKGVYACGYSLFLKNMLRTFLSESSSIESAIKKTSSIFYSNTGDSGMFVTLCVYCYSYKTNVIEYYSCGHNPACYLTPDGEVSFLAHPGMALGFVENVPEISTKQFHPQPGSLIVLYSDGITEANNKYSEMFGEERLKNIVKTLTKKSAENAMHSLMLAVHNFVGNQEQHDDITLVILKISES